MPLALISTRTSPALGPSRSSSTISSGFFASKATAARVFMKDGLPKANILRRDEHLGARQAQSAPDPGAAPRRLHFVTRNKGPRNDESRAGISDHWKPGRQTLDGS